MSKMWNSGFIYYNNNNPNKHKTVWVMEKEIEDGIIVISGCGELMKYNYPFVYAFLESVGDIK